MRSIGAAFALICTIGIVTGSKILAIFPFQAKSHYAAVEPLVKRLCANGHEVTSITHFPQKTKTKNLIDIDISKEAPTFVESVDVAFGDGLTIWQNALLLTDPTGSKTCDPILSHPEVTRLIRSEEKFDLVIVEPFGTDCFLGFVHKFDVPWVGITSSVNMPWTGASVGAIENPSYLPHFFASTTEEMNFFERFTNTYQLLGMKILYRIYSDWPSHEAAKKHFGSDLPDLEELRSRLALSLNNAHLEVSAARPLPPATKEVGGFHIPAEGPPPLPKDLQEYLDTANDGVIFFSMGSVVNATSFPPKIFQALINAFKKLAPVRVLWKFKGAESRNLPKNVKTVAWAPQLSVLCHKNVKVFMSHGGMLSTQEAVYCGVPVLGFPLFGDQNLNIARARKRGFAMSLNFHRLTEDEAYSSLKQLLTDNSYSDRANEASKKFRDRPIHPLDEAVFWIEYVLRNGPDALKIASTDLAWYQYLLLDVVAATIFMAFLAFCLLRKFVRLLYSSEKQKPVSKQKTK